MIISGSDGLEFPDGSDQATAFTGNAATITSGTIATARLATGTANSSTYLRGDQTWAAVPAATPGGSTTQVQYNNAGAFGGSANFVWDNTNVRLGVGTASPLTRLEVNGNASLTGAQPTFVGNIRITDNPTAVNAAGGLEFFTSNFASGYGWKMASIDSSGVQLTFSTRQNSATWTEAMRINSSGRVGIGTASPSSLLDVNTSAAGNFVARITNNSGASSTDHALLVETSTASAAKIISARNAGVERFVVTGSGDVIVNNTFQFNSGYGSAATAYGCRAWVNFNGKGTIATRASGNVSSLTDDGTGQYRVNFTNAMPDVNFAVCASASDGTTYGGYHISSAIGNDSTGSARVWTGWTGGAADQGWVYIAIFR